MSKNELAKRNVKKWAAKIGSNEAQRRLINAKLSISTAVKLVGGNYESTPNDITTDILMREMALDGFTLDGEKAS